MAWSDDDTFVVLSLNSSSEFGNRISSVSLLGGADTVTFSVEADGLHLGPVTRPAAVKHAFVFRLHLDGSAVGFVAWDLPHEESPTIIPGGVCHLRWMSGGTSDERLAIEMWTGTTWDVIDDAVPNTRAYTWHVPHDLPVGEPTLRIRAVDELSVQHVTSFPRRR